MLGEIIELPKIMDPRGNLTVAEQLKNIPFEVRRVYWTYDIPAGEHRGGHAHKQCRELVVAVSGSFTVTLTDGQTRSTHLLNRPFQDFSSGAVCLVLAEDYFEEEDYIRNYDDFLGYVKEL